MNINYYLSVYNKQKVLKSCPLYAPHFFEVAEVNSVPRIGEKVLIKGTMYTVKDIVNNFDLDEIAIMLTRYRNGN